ncbi:hypothetical protein [Glycomyces sp. NPDC048151]|uniref:hypothetical protein n=1 Tax=Glycomyces sp. NPDC048151 TaxID=3364002 RepID=UPI003715D5B3
MDNPLLNAEDARERLDQWKARSDGPAARCRPPAKGAQDLLLFFVHEVQSGRVSRVLERSNVPTVRLEAGAA